MRIFGSESMNNVLEKLGLKDGESIEHPWINKALERAQQKVEARNFDIRKTLLKFDDVLNDQRHVIFTQRNEVIKSKEIFDYSGIEYTRNTLEDTAKSDETFWFHIQPEWIDLSFFYENVFHFIDEDVLTQIKCNDQIKILIWFPTEGFDYLLTKSLLCHSL